MQDQQDLFEKQYVSVNGFISAIKRAILELQEAMDYLTKCQENPKNKNMIETCKMDVEKLDSTIYYLDGILSHYKEDMNDDNSKDPFQLIYKTPSSPTLDDYSAYLHKVLYDMGGRGKIKDVIELVGHVMELVLTVRDREKLPGTGLIRWKSRVRFARIPLVEREVLHSKPMIRKDGEIERRDTGYWVLTEKGMTLQSLNQSLRILERRVKTTEKDQFLLFGN